MRTSRLNDGLLLLLTLAVVVGVSSAARMYYSMLQQSRVEAAGVNMCLNINEIMTKTL